MRARTWTGLVAACAVFAAVLVPGSPARAGNDGAFVGMFIQGMNEVIAEAMGLGEPRGVLVRDVALGGPAAAAGFERGDLIVSVNGETIGTFDQMVKVVRAAKVGDTLPITVLRAGAEQKLDLQTGKWPDGWGISRGAFAAIPETGLTFSAITAKVRQRFGLRWGSVGVVVTLVDPDRSKGTDIRRGDIVVQVDQKAVWHPEQVSRAYQNAKAGKRKNLLMLVEGVDGFRFSLLPVR